MGFWTIDYLAVEYEYAPAPKFQEVPFVQAIDHLDQDVTEAMMQVDGSYYVMPEVGDWAKLSFNAPAQPQGTARAKLRDIIRFNFRKTNLNKLNSFGSC
jgi:hypothetical protein